MNLEYVLKHELPAPVGWWIDLDALGDFLKELEITLPFKIKTNANCESTYGTHTVRRNTHRIVLSPHLSAARTNSTLLHEIAHAWQSEKTCPDNPAAFYKRYYKGNGYKYNKFEIHADKFAKQFASRKLVCSN